MPAETNRRTLTDLLNTDYILSFISKEDSQGNKVHLSYNRETKWGVAHLSTLERIAKILPSCFLRLLGLGYIADTKIDHLFSHRSDDLGKVDAPEGNKLINEINDLFVGIWKNKKNKQLDQFFIPPPLTLVQIKAVTKRIDHFLNEFDKFLEDLENLEELNTLYQFVKRFNAEESELERLKKYIPNIYLEEWNAAEGDLERVKSKLNAKLSEKPLNAKLNQLLNDLTLKGQFSMRKNLENAGVALELPSLPKPTTNKKSKATSFIPGIINNSGNDCYLNATLQSLLASPKFQKMVGDVRLKKRDGENASQFAHRKKLLDCLKNKIIITYNSSLERDEKIEILSREVNRLKSLIHRANIVQFKKGKEGTTEDQQQDAFEVFQVLFEALDLNTFNFQSFIYYGEGEVSEKVEKTFSLTLPLVGNSIADCIKAWSSREEGEGLYVADDSKRYPFEKQVFIKDAPDFIPLQLSRFRTEFDPKKKRCKEFKIGKELKVDEIIDMSPLIKNRVEGEKYLYRVRSAITHGGSGTGSGHYVADVKIGNQWHHCNDSVTKLVDEGKVNVASAYIFILERVPQDEVVENTLIGKKEGVKSTVVSQKAPVGLSGENMEYLNSLMQALFSMDSFRDLTKFSDGVDPKKQKVKETLLEVYRAYREPEKKNEERFALTQNFRKALAEAELFEMENDPQNLHDILSQFFALLDNPLITKTVKKNKNKGVTSQVVKLPTLESGRSLVSAMEEVLQDVKNLPKILPVIRQKEGISIGVSTKQTLEVIYGEDKKMNYRLKSFILDQTKDSPYISYVKRGDHWYSVDQLKVKKMDVEDIKKAASQASIFFFESN